jgi:hypothetical protein
MHDKTPFTSFPLIPYNNTNVCARFDKRSDDSGRAGSYTVNWEGLFP